MNGNAHLAHGFREDMEWNTYIATFERVVAIWKNTSKTNRHFSHDLVFSIRSPGAKMSMCLPNPSGISTILVSDCVVVQSRRTITYLSETLYSIYLRKPRFLSHACNKNMLRALYYQGYDGEQIVPLIVNEVSAIGVLIGLCGQIGDAKAHPVSCS